MRHAAIPHPRLDGKYESDAIVAVQAQLGEDVRRRINLLAQLAIRKADSVGDHDRRVPIPAVIRLSRYVRVPYRSVVPLTRREVFADVYARWRLPVILCARTGLGTINHTLLSLEAMRQRLIPVLGIAFIGDAHPDTEQIIVEMGGVRSLGRLPRLDPLTPGALRRSFQAHFDISLFRTMKT